MSAVEQAYIDAKNVHSSLVAIAKASTDSSISKREEEEKGAALVALATSMGKLNETMANGVEPSSHQSLADAMAEVQAVLVGVEESFIQGSLFSSDITREVAATLQKSGLKTYDQLVKQIKAERPMSRAQKILHTIENVAKCVGDAVTIAVGVATENPVLVAAGSALLVQDLTVACGGHMDIIKAMAWPLIIKPLEAMGVSKNVATAIGETVVTAALITVTMMSGDPEEAVQEGVEEGSEIASTQATKLQRIETLSKRMTAATILGSSGAIADDLGLIPMNDSKAVWVKMAVSMGVTIALTGTTLYWGNEVSTLQAGLDTATGAEEASTATKVLAKVRDNTIAFLRSLGVETASIGSAMKLLWWAQITFGVTQAISQMGTGATQITMGEKTGEMAETHAETESINARMRLVSDAQESAAQSMKSVMGGFEAMFRGFAHVDAGYAAVANAMSRA